MTHPVNSISFIVNTIQHGQFTLVGSPAQAITQFTQSQVNTGQVQFVHDGSFSAPSYTMEVQGKTFARSTPQAATVTFHHRPTITTQFPAVVQLSALNGQNGFKLDGEASDDESGVSVSTAGDINGDGHADLLVGAFAHNGQTGRSYVVFGGPSVGGSGLLALSSLNGANGFKLDGEASGDLSGLSVSAAGDINGDGMLIYWLGLVRIIAVLVEAMWSLVDRLLVIVDY